MLTFNRAMGAPNPSVSSVESSVVGSKCNACQHNVHKVMSFIGNLLCV